MNIGFIGCGKIAEPIIRFISRKFPHCSIPVSNRTESVSSRLCEEFSIVQAGENQWVLDNSDIVFLCVLADVARNQLPQLQFKPSHQVISVMAGVSLDELRGLIQPAKDPCITIPLPFIEAGNCPLPVYPESKILQQLFALENRVITVSNESLLGSHFAATAILSTLMAQLNQTSSWLAEKSGNSSEAEIYVATLVSGYLDSIRKDGNNRFLHAIEDLTTEGGLNFQLLNHNRNAGMLDTLESGLEMLDRRLTGDSQKDY